MANPATIGPSDPEVEKPSASQEKFRARREVSCAPMTLFMPMCTSMKAVPHSVLERYRMGR